MKGNAGSWMVAAVAALSLACALDLVLAAPIVGPEAWIALVGLTIAMGGLCGWLMWLVSSGLSRLSLPTRALVTLTLAAALCLNVVARLGGFVRLGGNYSLLAIATIGSGLLASVMITAIVLGFVPSVEHPRGRVFVHRAWAWVALAGLSAASFATDQRALVGLYPLFHVSLRAASLTTGTLALWLVLPQVALARSVRVLWIAPFLSFATALGVAAARPAAVFPLELAPWPLLVLTTARELTDIDLDGYSAMLGGGDCAPFSPRINPGASEIVDNGIDDNCLLGDAKATDASEAVVDDTLPPPTQDIVLITVDSLRPDHMGVYDDAYRAPGLATTPNIDAWAGHETLVFDRAYTAGGWTSIALPSLLRGVYPRHLTWNRRFETNRFRLVRRRELSSLSDGEMVIKMFPTASGATHPTLASRLKHRGMRTMAVVDDGFSDQLGRGSGLAEGFDEYRKVDELSADARGDHGATDLAIRLLERVADDDRFFLWVHYFGPHSPNERHAGVRLDGTSLEQTYDHELRFVDQQLARLLRVLSGRQRAPVIVITADHGEDFIDDGRHHGFSLNEAVVRVPLMVRVPDTHGRRIATPVSLVDVVPTILGLTGTPLARELDGIALQQTVDATGDVPRRLLADTWQYDHEGRLIRGQTAAFDGRHKVLFDRQLASWTIESQSAHSRTKRVSPQAKNPLVQTLVSYLESTGGDLRLED